MVGIMESVTLFKVKDLEALQPALDGLCQLLTAHNVQEERLFDCKLIACELVGNVLKYTNGEAGLQVQFDGEFVTLKAVSESFFRLPTKIVCSDITAESGRGLFLVHTLCEGCVSAEQDGIVAKVKIKA